MSLTARKLKVLLHTATKSDLNMFTHIKYIYTFVVELLHCTEVASSDSLQFCSILLFQL